MSRTRFRPLCVYLIGVLLCLALSRSAQAAENAVIVESVPAGSPALKAGLQAGDQLLSYADIALTSPESAYAQAENRYGQPTFPVRLLRDGKQLTITLPPGDPGWRLRPDLAADLMALHQKAQQSLAAGKHEEAAGQWSEAAVKAEQSGASNSAAWLYRKAGSAWLSGKQAGQALAFYRSAQKALEGQSEPASLYLTASALAQAAEAARDGMATQSAWDQALKVARQAGYPGWEARALDNSAWLAYARRDLLASERFNQQALEIRRKIAPGSMDMADSLSRLGAIAHARTDLSAAESYGQQALEIQQRLAPGSLRVAGTLGNLGNVASARGDFPAADRYYLQALEIVHKLSPPGSLDLGGVLVNLGRVAYYRGDLPTAERYTQQALEIQQKLVPGSLGMADCLNNLGLIAHDRGDLPAAERYLQQALQIQQKVAPGSLEVARCLNNLGLVAGDRGDLPAAERYYQQALEIRQKRVPDSLDLAVSFNNLGLNAYARGDLSAADRCFHQAMEIRQKRTPGSLDLAASFSNLGVIAKDRRELTAAERYFQQALAIKQKTKPGSLAVAAILTGLGDVARDRGDLPAAEHYLLQALEIGRKLATGSPEAASSLSYLGRLGLAVHRLPEALSLLQESAARLEGQRQKIASLETRSLFAEQHIDVYASLIDACLQNHDPAEAFHSLERSRARTLTEKLFERTLNTKAKAPPPLLARQQNLDNQRRIAYRDLQRSLDRLDTLKKQNTARPIADFAIQQQKLQQEEQQARRQIEDVAVQQRQLEADIRRADPHYAALAYPQAIDIKKAQAALEPGTLLLAYQVAAEKTTLFAVTRTGIQTFTLPVKAEALTKQVTQFREKLVSNAYDNERGRALYDLLLKPAAKQIATAQRLLLCPDGPLQTLPFAALVTTPSSQPRRYLIEEKPLHVTSSMSVYAQTKQEAAQRKAAASNSLSLLAIGDPIYDASAPVVVSTAKRFHTLGGPKLERLEELGRQVRAIAKQYPNALLLTEKNATKRQLLAQASRARVLHFACHGLLDNLDPLASSLALTPEGKEDDGLLRAYEILEKLELKAELVVLSACQTGLGKESKSEGIQGLTRAFLYAGAPSVLVSLWEIADTSSTALMTEFHRLWRSGKSKDEALRQAQLQLLSGTAGGDYRTPYHWAAYLLVGNHR